MGTGASRVLFNFRLRFYWIVGVTSVISANGTPKGIVG